MEVEEYKELDRDVIREFCRANPSYVKKKKDVPAYDNITMFNMTNPAKVRYPQEEATQDKAKLAILRQKYSGPKAKERYCNYLIVPAESNKKFDIKFYSRFESGNLLRVVKVPVKPELTFSGIEITKGNTVKAEYDLYLEPDTGTEGMMHWFYFKIYTKGLEKSSRVRLNIRNLVRSKSLY